MITKAKDGWQVDYDVINDFKLGMATIDGKEINYGENDLRLHIDRTDIYAKAVIEDGGGITWEKVTPASGYKEKPWRLSLYRGHTLLRRVSEGMTELEADAMAIKWHDLLASNEGTILSILLLTA